MDISKTLDIKIIGVGSVGTGIVQLFAQSGFKVHGIDIRSESIEKGYNKIETDLDKLAFRGKISSEEKKTILRRISLYMMRSSITGFSRPTT